MTRIVGAWFALLGATVCRWRGHDEFSTRRTAGPLFETVAIDVWCKRCGAFYSEPVS